MEDRAEKLVTKQKYRIAEKKIFVKSASIVAYKKKRMA